MKFLKTSIYLFIAIFLGACSNSVDIVENGDTNYAIIIAQQPNEQESRAASLLQEYIEKMTGCKIPITNAPVFPVPDCDCAIRSFPFMICKMAFRCIGDGFSNPYENIPLNKGIFNDMSSNSLTSG